MVGDQNYLKVKKVLLFFLTYLFSQASFANDIKISKIIDLEDPWGSTFINDKEFVTVGVKDWYCWSYTKKGGKKTLKK